MKIVLFTLNASYVHTSLALRALASPLRDEGFEVVILERTLKDRRELVLELLVKEKADVYGFSCYIWNISEMLAFAADLHALLPDCKIVFGGPEVSFESSEYINTNPFIDYIIRGEGETALKLLCINIRDGMKAAPFIDGAPFSGFETAGILYDSVPYGKLIYYESSRGCPYRCSYCLSSLSGKVRAKNADTVLEELLEFEQPEFEAKIIKFVDRTFNYDRKRARKIWNGLQSDCYTKTYHFEICASLLEEEDFAILALLPPRKIQIEAGVQSTNSDTLRAISRNPETAYVIKNLKKLRKAGNIHIHADLIAGLPLESITSFRNSFDCLWDACDMLQLGFLKLLKGSKLRDEADKWGYRFMSEPPYTVLSNNYMSFDDIMRLHHINSVLERFSNSGNFTHSLRYIITRSSSPFDVFDRISLMISDDIGKLGQAAAFKLLNDYAITAGLHSPEFVNYLRFDWLSHESAAPQDFLREYMPAYENELVLRLSHEFGGEIYVFNFGCGVEYYTFNRKRHTMQRIL